MNFGNTLRALRQEHHLSQEALGKTLCVTKMCISHWEKGDSEPSISQLISLAKLFDVTIDYLVGEQE